jgi:hypothetical protein
MNKATSQMFHAMKRAAERYGVECTLEMYWRLKNRIQKKEARFIARKTNRITIWEVEQDGRIYKVAYDTKRHQIASFLP